MQIYTYVYVCMYVHTNANEEKQNTIPVGGCRFSVEVWLSINDLYLPKTLCCFGVDKCLCMLQVVVCSIVLFFFLIALTCEECIQLGFSLSRPLQRAHNPPLSMWTQLSAHGDPCWSQKGLYNFYIFKLMWKVEPSKMIVYSFCKDWHIFLILEDLMQRQEVIISFLVS